MNVTFPDRPGLSGAFLLGHRRRPGSPVSGDNIEQVISVIVKRAYTVTASPTDPAAGGLMPRADGPEIFEGDQPGAFLGNGDFADGLTGWTQTGGARATAGDHSVTILRDGPAGDLRRSAGFARTLRDRDVGFSVDASAEEGLVLPQMLLVAGSQTFDADEPAPGGTFPEPDKQPVTLSGFAEITSSAATTSVRLGTLGVDGQSVTYAAASAASIEYETDLVPFKPEADLIVIADGDPVPVSVAVDGVIRMSQAAVIPQTLTGLGWERRFGTAREADGGAFVPPPPQALPNEFDNRFYNGYRRDRRLGGATVPYPADGAEIVLTDADGDVYAFTLTTGAPSAIHAWFSGSGPDDPCLWRRRSLSFALDTLVIEPDRDVAYAVWRVSWPVDFDPDGTGPVPLGDNRSVSVDWEGA